MKKVIRLTESDLMRIVRRVINEQTNGLTPDKINTLSTTSTEDGVPGMIKSGILSYKDEQGTPITFDLTSISGAANIRLAGNVNVDVNSTLFGYLSEYNLTLNPSVISGSVSAGEKNGIPYGFVTESYFSPYITTIGLYDEAQNLLAIGKLAQPLPSSPTTDTTILINLDR